ncbi:SsrA-binding protein [Flavobacteriaceae bacterium]|nr:SsrA-binding protein [Flavobacteriaceae bacterium]
MKLIIFKTIAKLNKFLLPSLSKKRLDLSKANKFDLILFSWKLFITKKIINQ